MNWGRGLFRLWLLAVPFWGLWWFYYSGALGRKELTTGDWIAFVMVLVSAPGAVLGLGYGIVWVIEGFDKSKPN